MAKATDLAALRAMVRFRDLDNPEANRDHALICPHGDSGTGKSSLWGMFGKGAKGKALLVQGEKGDRDIYNGDIGIIDVNTMFNIGKVSHLTEGEVEGDIVGDMDNLKEMSMGWEMIRSITDDLQRTGGRNVNPAGIPLEYVVFDSGTTIQQMLLSWILHTMPDRKRVPGPGGTIRPSLEDYGDLVRLTSDWMVELRDLKRRMTISVPWLTQDNKYDEVLADGTTVVSVVKQMPMCIGRKLPKLIVSYADFAPYHQMIEQTVMVDDPDSPGKKRPYTRLVRGLRWAPSSKIFAKGRGRLPDAHPLYTPEDSFTDGPYAGELMGYDCHEVNIRRICEMALIPRWWGDAE